MEWNDEHEKEENNNNNNKNNFNGQIEKAQSKA